MRSKNILKSLLFFSILIILLFTLSNVFFPKDSIEEGPYKKLSGFFKQPKNSLDYIAIGDSECSTSIIPLEIWKNYGYAGYNCGIPGQQIQNTYYILQKLLEKQSPKIVLLETNTFFRNVNYTNDLQNVSDEVIANTFSIYKYHDNWRQSVNELIRNPFFSNLNNANARLTRGYYFNYKRKPYTKGPYQRKTENVENVSEQTSYYLNKIVMLCKQKNVQLILYSTPSPLCWTYAKHNAASLLANEYHLSYIDLNLHTKELRINWRNDTRDRGNHLNYYGAKKVTAYMGSYLYQSHDLVDHRGEKQYISWNKALSKYLKLKKAKRKHI